MKTQTTYDMKKNNTNTSKKISEGDTYTSNYGTHPKEKRKHSSPPENLKPEKSTSMLLRTNSNIHRPGNIPDRHPRLDKLLPRPTFSRRRNDQGTPPAAAPGNGQIVAADGCWQKRSGSRPKRPRYPQPPPAGKLPKLGPPFPTRNLESCGPDFCIKDGLSAMVRAKKKG